MKQISFITSALICGAVTLSSCDKQDIDGDIDNDVYAAFRQEFPDATGVSWRTSGNYTIAFFEKNDGHVGNVTGTAWFEKASAEFKMYEYEILFSSLPQAVTAAFNASDYSRLPWKHDEEVDVIKKIGENLVLYVIEVEKEENNKETEAELYYSEEGVLVKEVIDASPDHDYTDLLPTQPANGAYSWVESKYPGAKVVEVEFEDGNVKVEFIFGEIRHEALLTAGYEWIYTKKDYNRNTSVLPEAALNHISANYQNYYIEDIEYYETASKGNFYSVEIESGNGIDIELQFHEDGTLRAEYRD